MRDPALLKTLEEVLDLEATSFVRYLVLGSDTQPQDEFDRKVWSLYQDWHRASEQNQLAIRDLLDREDYIPFTGIWPLQYSQYNFLTPGYLLDSVVRLMEKQLGDMERRVARFDDWPEARDLLTAIVERERLFLERAKKMVAECPSSEPQAPEVKGTSASRW